MPYPWSNNRWLVRQITNRPWGREGILILTQALQLAEPDACRLLLDHGWRVHISDDGNELGFADMMSIDQRAVLPADEFIDVSVPGEVVVAAEQVFNAFRAMKGIK